MTEQPKSLVGFPLGVVFVTLLAVLLREWYVLVTQVDAPIRGDIVQYMAYAWNLLEHQTFSMTHVASGLPPPDAFRGPGYPLFLAVPLGLARGEGPWYPLALQMQVALAALTCTLTAVCARRAVSAGWAVLAGLLLAVWPHHIAATGTLLSEVVFGFSLMLALWLNLRALEAPSGWRALACGLVYAYAFLVNPLAAPLAFGVAALGVLRTRNVRLAWIAALPLIVATGWQTRNALVVGEAQTHPNRGLINLVEGSWPLYHAAYNSRHAHEEAAAIMQDIAMEERLIVEDLGSGLSAMATRMSEAPVDYALWYLVDKPWLLWDWDIRIGAGDIYFHEVRHSPLETHPLLRALKSAARAANPVLYGLCLVIVAFWAGRAMVKRSWPQPAELHIAAGFIWFTAIHALLQAEPRYAIAYRPYEMMLVTISLAWLTRLAIRKPG